MIHMGVQKTNQTQMVLRSFIHSHPRLAIVVFSLAAAAIITFLDNLTLVFEYYFYLAHPFMRFLYPLMPDAWYKVQLYLTETIFWLAGITTVVWMARLSRRLSLKGLAALSIAFSGIFTAATLSVVSNIFLNSHGSTAIVGMGAPYHYLIFGFSFFDNFYSPSTGGYSLEAMKLAYDVVIWFLFYLILAIIARYVPIRVVLVEKPSWDKRGKKVVHLEGKR